MRPGANRTVRRLGGRSVEKRARSAYGRERFASNLRAQALAREFGVRSPRIRRVCFSRRTYVESWIAGSTLAESTGALESSEAARNRFLADLAAQLRRLHELVAPAPAESCCDAGAEASWSQVLSARIDALAGALSGRGSDAGLRNARRALREEAASLPSTIRPALVHFDISPLNIMLDEKGRVHLIDWECSRFYDPLWDVAGVRKMFSELGWGGDAFEKFWSHYRGGRAIPHARRRLSLYGRLLVLRKLPYL